MKHFLDEPGVWLGGKYDAFMRRLAGDDLT
jgi:hypothetical protein